MKSRSDMNLGGYGVTGPLSWRLRDHAPNCHYHLLRNGLQGRGPVTPLLPWIQVSREAPTACANPAR